MTLYKEFDEDRLGQMYLDGVTIKNMERAFDTTSATIYRHLKDLGIESDRKIDIPWSPQEDDLLIKLKNAGGSGSDVYDKFPNRRSTSVKSRVQKLRIDKKLR